MAFQSKLYNFICDSYPILTDVYNLFTKNTEEIIKISISKCLVFQVKKNSHIFMPLPIGSEGNCLTDTI